MLNVPTPSWASPLPQGFALGRGHRFNTEPCGSELARESVSSGNQDVECTAAFVGKPTPTGIYAGLKIIRSTPKPVGASLLAKAPDQAIKMLNVPPPSWASPLPQDSALGRGPRFNTETCGSEPARESVSSDNQDVECTAAFVSRLAHTGIYAGLKIIRSTPKPARESARSGNQNVECTAAFVGKPTLTGIYAGLKIIRSTPNPVGASLLAKTPDQAITMLNVPPPS